MTRISRKIITWLLGAFAFMTLLFAIAVGSPLTQKAKAATQTSTWNTELSVDGIENYKRYRFNTPSLMWSGYNNESYADEYLANTMLNGKTVKSLNEEAARAGSTQKIWACLHPAGFIVFACPTISRRCCRRISIPLKSRRVGRTPTVKVRATPTPRAAFVSIYSARRGNP